jgi:hypothetical protein
VSPKKKLFFFNTRPLPEQALQDSLALPAHFWHCSCVVFLPEQVEHWQSVHLNDLWPLHLGQTS